MKLIREHIEFKRNVDPKEAMGTGIVQELINDIEKIQHRYKSTTSVYVVIKYFPQSQYIKIIFNRFTPIAAFYI